MPGPQSGMQEAGRTPTENPPISPQLTGGYLVIPTTKHTIAMATSSVSRHQTRIESQIDARQRLNEAKAEMQGRALDRAKTRIGFAGLLSEIIRDNALDPKGMSRRLAYDAMKTLPDDELAAWLADAKGDWEDLTREEDFDKWSLLGSLIQYGEHLLYNGSTEAQGEGHPYHVTAQPSGPRERPTRIKAVPA